MRLNEKIILLISPEPWDHIFVSKHHYAVHLAKLNNVVYFLNPPSGRFEVQTTQFPNVHSLQYEGFPKGLRFYPAFLRRWYTKHVFEGLQKFVGVRFDIIWSFDNSVFYDLDALEKGILKISHIVDSNQNFQTKTASSSADFCFCNTESIKRRLMAYSSKVYKIQHGLNIVLNPPPVDLPGGAKIKALYSGNLAIPFIDWKILYEVVSAYKEIDFIFLGPNADEFSASINPLHPFKEKVMKLDNVFKLGRVDSGCLISYLKCADILIMAYQEEYQKDQVSNSHKMMEYLYSGKVIVTTYTSEYEDISNLMVMTKQNSEFKEIFSKVSMNLHQYNRVELCEARTRFAISNSYEKQIERIQNIITN